MADYYMGYIFTAISVVVILFVLSQLLQLRLGLDSLSAKDDMTEHLCLCVFRAGITGLHLQAPLLYSSPSPAIPVLSKTDESEVL